MKQFHILGKIMRQTGIYKYWTGFLMQVFLTAAFIWLWEPDIHSYGEALWYCYALVTTVGFGDVVVTRLLSRILSVALSANAVIVIALITGMAVNFYNQVLELKRKETMTAFIDKLEHLPELPPEELKEISEKVKEFQLKG